MKMLAHRDDYKRVEQALESERMPSKKVLFSLSFCVLLNCLHFGEWTDQQQLKVFVASFILANSSSF